MQMKKYRVLIEETLGTTIVVLAQDEDQADEIANKVYSNCDVVLDAECLSDCVIGGEYTDELPADNDEEPDFTPDYLTLHSS